MSLTHAVSALDSAWTSHPVSEELREKVRLSTYLAIITCQQMSAPRGPRRIRRREKLTWTLVWCVCR